MSPPARRRLPRTSRTPVLHRRCRRARARRRLLPPPRSAMDLARLVDESHGLALSAAIGDIAGIDVTSVEYDSRAVAPGALFACIPGLVADGHDFAADAVDRGAVALLVERRVPVDVPQLL